MFKRVLSFIIILISVATLSFTLFAKDMFSSLVSNGQNSAYAYAYAVDSRDNVYYMQNDSGSISSCRLIGLDSTGKRFCDRDVTAITGKGAVVDSLYITQDNMIVMTVYTLDADTGRISRVSVNLFREDGSFVANAFKRETNINYDGKYRVISDMSDDDNNIYFGYLSGSRIDTFTLNKNKITDNIKKTGSYTVSTPENINAFLALPSGDVIMSLQNGLIVKKNVSSGDSSFTFSGGAPVIITDFWYADKHFYCRDAVSGDIDSSLTGEMNISTIVRGTKAIPGSGGVKLRQMRQISIGTSDNFVGVLESSGKTSIFIGGFEFLSKIQNGGASAMNSLLLWLLFAGVVAGIIIVTLLCWDFFCNVMHMQISLIVRQSLLICLVIYLSLYTLTENVIVTKTGQISISVYKSQQLLTAQMLADSMQRAVTASDGKAIDNSRLTEYFNRFGGEAPDSGNLGQTHVYLIKNDGAGYKLIASGDGYEPGMPVDSLTSTQSILALLDKTVSGATFSSTVFARQGEMFCTLLPTKMNDSGTAVVLAVLSPLGGLDQNTQDMKNIITFYMRLIGIILIILVILVESITAINLKKLRRNVDKIAGGNYAAKIELHSGDETEALSKSITALARNILSVTQSLNKLNSFYYRFVPQRFLETIGETHIENVGKTSQAYKENVVMLFLRFNFNGSSGKDSEEIFANINAVFEKIVPVVNENGGTVYNFLPNGFNAVFDNEPDEVLHAAFHIREVLGIINKESGQNGKSCGEVDIRLFLTIGNIMLGFIGDETRMEPTAISDTAQKAERIEKICFDSTVYIACTRNFLDGLPKNQYRCRRIGKIALEKEQLELFDLFDSDPFTILKSKELNADTFEQGVRQFEKSDYKNALTSFIEIIKRSTADGTARNYMFLSDYNMRASDKQNFYTTMEEFERTHNVKV